MTRVRRVRRRSMVKEPRGKEELLAWRAEGLEQRGNKGAYEKSVDCAYM